MEVPSFNEDTLSSLTSRINAKLSAAATKSTENDVKAAKQKLAKAKISKGKQQAQAGDKGRKSQTNRTDSNSKQQRFPINHRTENSAQKVRHEDGSKKHLRTGELKTQKGPKAKDRTKSSTRDDELLKTIAELGGTEEDLELIQDVDSDSELEPTGLETDSKLKKDLKGLVQELGISKLRVDVQGSPGIEEASEGEDESDDASTRDPFASRTGSSSKVKPSSSTLLLEPQAEWHSAELPALTGPQYPAPASLDIVAQLHQRGKDLLEAENDTYAASHKSSSAHQFYSTIMTSGTLTDRISALTLSVQESPLHNVRAFESLLGLAKKRSRAQAIEVLNALKDLFAMGGLLPSDRHLRTFMAQPGLTHVPVKALQSFRKSSPPPRPLKDVHLIVWAYEDWLKSKYFEMLQTLETWLSDEIVFSRTRAVDMAYELLREKPEQEANLLRLLVNKLGDREKKVASKASYNILQLQSPHPSMAANIIKSIETDILFKPGQTLHAKYYAMITLNQTVLSTKDQSTVKKVLDLYFAMFLTLLKNESTAEKELAMKNNKGELQGGGGKPGRMAEEKRLKAAQKGLSAEEAVRDKIMSAVLTGINRAIPFTDTTDEFFGRHLDTLFRVTHSANFNTSIQSLMLIQQLCESHPSASDRFYRTLYESLLDPRLLNSSKQILYLNLLYRALRADLNVKRVQAFAKRLLQCIAMHQPAFACGVLFLLRELEGQFPALALLIDQPEEGLGEEETSSKKTVNGTSADQEGNTADGYDGKKRAPEHSHADRTCLWELGPLAAHFHPSVSLFASRLLTHEEMPPKPDLESHTLTHFLDRFVYRNPKKVSGKMHGSSLMQPLAANDSSGLLVAPTMGRSEVPVNSDAFAKMADNRVKADEVFFHKYFNTKAKAQGAAKAKKEKRRAAATEDSEDEEEAEIWQALVDSRPEIEDDDADMDDDMEMDMDDFSDLEADESPDDMELEDDSDSDGGIELDLDDEEDEEEVVSEAEEESEKPSNPKTVAAKKRRKYLKSLPTFASVEDYAAMMDDVEGEEIAP